MRIEFGDRRDPRSDSYGDDAAEFYSAVSEVLGAGDFDSPMSLGETGVGTYVYMPADSPESAAENAVRLFSEASERVWWPGTRVRAERVVTAAERDRELAEEGVE